MERLPRPFGARKNNNGFARIVLVLTLSTFYFLLPTSRLFAASVWTETSDTDFADGVFNMTMTSGTGTAAQLTLSPFGNGSDGSVTISATKNINSDIISSGRVTYADGINYAVSGVWISSITCSAAPNGIVTGDEIILINQQGDATNNGNVGNYEFFRVAGVSGNFLIFTSSITKIYGATTNNNVLTGQKITAQRVPNWGNVTISGAGTQLTCSAWDGTKGGMVAFRSTGTVSVGSGASVDVSSGGFRGGVAGSNGAEDARNPNITTGGANGGNGQLSGSGGNGGIGSGGGTGGNGGAGSTGAGGTGGSNGGGGAGSGWQSGATSGAGGAAPYSSGSNYSTDTLLMMGGGASHGGGGGAGSYNANVPSGGNRNGGGGTCTSGGSGGNGGQGNRGGGIILIYTNQISGSGVISSNGGMGGGGGGGGGQGEQNAVAHGGGGGGGAGACGAAGGSVVIKYNIGPGSILISANGGPGGGGGGGGGSGHDSGYPTQNGSGGGGGAGPNGGGGGAGRRTSGVGANGGNGGTAGQNIGDGYGGSAGGGGGGYNSSASANTGGAPVAAGNAGANASGLNGGKGGDLTSGGGGSGGGGGAGANGANGYSSISSTGTIYYSPATYRSNVFDTGVAGIKFLQVSWNPSSQLSGTSISVGVRASDTDFTAGAASPEWTPVSNGGNPNVTGRYIQWMSTFTTTNSTTTPRLEDITITPAALPPAPTINYSGSETSTKITWKWLDNSSGAAQEDNFKIYTSTNGLIATLNPDTTHYTESGLKRNKEYSRYVQAYNTAGSSNSATITWRTKPGAFQSKSAQGQPTRTGANAFGFVGDASWDWDVPVKSGSALTITAHIRYNTEYGGSATKPKLTLSGKGISPTSISATSAAENAWELLTINAGTPSQNATLTLRADGFSTTPNAKFYVDDINVSQ